ncbi:Non-specific serine/threonine protein kinase [Bertholletia excelsa]
MEVHRVQLGLALILLLINSALTQKVIPLSSRLELSALLDLRASLGLRARDWPRKVDPCSRWTGVKCRTGRVVEIKTAGLRRTRVGRQNPRFSVNSLANLTRLETFNSSGFSLPGSIPDWFGERLGALQILDLRSCLINGTIPPSLGNLTGLKTLYLSHNLLTGSIPSSLGQLSSLSALNLSSNSLTGAIPSSFSALVNLSTLDLSSNYLSGTIPPRLGLLSQLEILHLQDNNLHGSVPSQLSRLFQLTELDLGNNTLSGSLPNGLFSNLTQLKYLALDRNNFDGNLSDILRPMPRLHFLDVSGNNFTSVLPNITALFNATGATFNFSDNRLFGNLTSLFPVFDFIDLSNNYFQGSVPDNLRNNILVAGNCLNSFPKQRNLRDCEVFYDSIGLPFGKIPSPPGSSEPTSKSKKQEKYIMMGVFGGLGFIVVLIAVLLLLRKTCGKQNTDQEAAKAEPVPGGSPPSPEGSITFSGVGEEFTYKQMLHATAEFSDANLIKHGHSGDIFRGYLEGGFPVVIKRVDFRSFRKEAYIAELEFLSKASHPRLVPLLGHCSELGNEKFLVYKYMPNGDLSNSLYKTTALEDDALQSLDWITRLKIAIGAAEGLTYLHDCTPPIVHRDIQASSILLDDKYEVRLGSLSEVHAEVGDNHKNAITRLFRIPQISEQGPSGSSSAACAYDVYCFGKVLLELVTGKLGISNTRLTLQQYLQHISKHDKDMVGKIVDQSLIVDDDLLKEVWSMAIVAKACLNPKPSRRPLMRHVLKALENPLKVVREVPYCSAKLRTTSSRTSWSSAFLGSWHYSSSDSGNDNSQTNREGISGSKQPGMRLSNEISSDTQEFERQVEDNSMV